MPYFQALLGAEVPIEMLAVLSLHLNDFLGTAEEQYTGLKLLLKTATFAEEKGNSKMKHCPS